MTMYRTWGDARKSARKSGRKEGLKAGIQRGQQLERKEALLTVLQVRGIPVATAERKRILAEKDPDRLRRWLERAVLARSLAEVLDERS